MATRLEQLTKAAVKAFVEKQGKTVMDVRHIFPRAYILAKPAPGCIVVAVPYMDGEPQCRRRAYNSQNIIRNFSDGLIQGDWCSVAYVVTGTCSEPVAIQMVKR